MDFSDIKTIAEAAWAVYTMNWAVAVPATWAVAEVVVRLTPTKKDDSLMERFGGGIRKFLNLVLVPNLKKK